MTFKILDQDPKFLTKHPENFEDYVAVQSRVISDFVHKEEDFYEGYVKISNPANNKSLVRRIEGHSAHGLEKGYAMIGCRTKNYLKLKEYGIVEIESISKYAYLWKNSNKEKRMTLRISVISLAVGLVSLFITLLCIIF